MFFQVHGSVFHFRARWMSIKVVVAFPVFRWPDGPGHKVATAVRTDVTQESIDARRAERAFIRADARLKRVRRQGFIAMLTGGSEFKHGIPFVQTRS